MKKIIAIVLATLCMVSCTDDILNKEPLSMISDAAVWKDQTLTNAFLTGIYIQMTILENDAVGTDYVKPTIVNAVSDECCNVWYWYYENTKKYDGLNRSGGLLEWWNEGYVAIRRLNEFIEKVSASADFPADFKREKVAEARFLRAFNYFALVKRYGGVPLITYAQPFNEPEETLYPARDSEKAIYDFVIAEMDAIGNDLLTVNGGRPTRWAALALKSRAALYAASIAQYGSVQLDGLLGFPASEAAKYYEISYNASETIMRESPHGLYNADADKVTNFKNIFLAKDNTESIWARKHDYTNYDAGGSGWGWDFLQCPKPHAWNAGNTNAPFLEMAEEFEYVDGSVGTLDRTAIQTGLWTMEDLWKDKDPRFFATIYTNETSWKGGKVDWHQGLIRPDGTIQADASYEGVLALGNQTIDGSFGTGFGVMKYLEESKDNMGPGRTSGTDWQIFRYAEILLNHAEAALELGKTGEALDAVNQIRDRAGIAPLSAIDRDKIRHERKVELAFEGHRYWDARRWRIATDVLTRNNSGLQYILDYNSTLTPTRKFSLKVIEKVERTSTHPLFYEYNYYLPITTSRTANNPKLVENPGYVQ